jgi:hypothetical protein
MSSEKKTYIINIIGAPGTGKTTTAALLFYFLKVKGYIAELVSEVAKPYVWQGKIEELNDQYHISREQYLLFKSMVGKVDFIVTDGSLIHGMFYNRYNKDNVSDVFITDTYIRKWYNEFNNINIYLERGNFEYENAGRIQDENESKLMDITMSKMIDSYKFDYKRLSLKGMDIEPFIEYIESFFKEPSNSQTKNN